MFYFFAKKKKTGMKKHSNGEMQHLITREGAYWEVPLYIDFIKNLKGTRPNIQGRGGTTNESAQ